MSYCISPQSRRPGASFPRNRDVALSEAFPRLHKPTIRLNDHGFAPVPTLESQLEGSKLPDLDDLIRDYFRSEPNAASAELEVELFLDWIGKQTALDQEERDYLTSMYSQQPIEAAALNKHLSHARFMEMLARTPASLKQLTPTSRYAIRLNPVHVWAAFQTQACAESDDDSRNDSACVLFYQIGNDVRTAILNEDVQALIRTLERKDLKVSTLFSKVNEENHDNLTALLRELAELKIIAIA